MSILIQGVAFPLNTLNSNGWGVPESDAGSAIETLKNSVIRVCSRDSEHGCDFTEDPYSEVGRVTDAWREGNLVYAAGIITDPEAEAKIKAGTWEKKWSVFGYDKSTGAWTQDFRARSLTLVRFPAWEASTWAVSASKGGERGLSLSSNVFKVLEASDKTLSKKCSCKKVGGHMPNEDGSKTIEEQLAEAKEQLAAANKQLEETKGQGAQIEALTASNKKLEEDNKKNVAKIAALEKDKAVSLSASDVTKLIEEREELAAKKAAKEMEEKLEAKFAAEKENTKKEAAFSRLAAAHKVLKIEAPGEGLKVLSAAALEESAAQMEALAKKASSEPNKNMIPPDPKYAAKAPSNGANTGIYDPYKGTFA